MSIDPMTVLQAAHRATPPGATVQKSAGAVGAATHTQLLIAGAAGPLGQAVLHRLVGGGGYARTLVLTRSAYTDTLRGLDTWVVPHDDPAQWPNPTPWRMGEAGVVGTAVLSFDVASPFGGRELALWTPQPHHLPALAHWLLGLGVHTLALVSPHAQGRLPAALRQGLANLDEHRIATMGFTRLLVLRAARAAGPQDWPEGLAGWPARLAQRMLSISQYMVPSPQQPLRTVALAHVLDAALAVLPDGVHVLPPELLWQAAQGDAQQVLEQWARLGRVPEERSGA